MFASWLHLAFESSVSIIYIYEVLILQDEFESKI
jgi:hypothetical protein